MTLQHLAARLSCGQVFAASVPQGDSLAEATYLFPPLSRRVAGDCLRAVTTSERGQAGRVRAECFETLDRSRRCPKASNCLPCSLSSQAFPLVRSKKKKSTSWSIPSPSRLSRFRSNRCTQASTSKNLSGRACASVPFFRTVGAGRGNTQSRYAISGPNAACTSDRTGALTQTQEVSPC